MPITFRVTEAQSPNGDYYRVTTESGVWDSVHYRTQVVPVTQDDLSPFCFEKAYQTQKDAIFGHEGVVNQVIKGDIEKMRIHE